MSKAGRVGQQVARERIAAQQAAARRADKRRRMLLVGGSVVVVIAIVVAFIVVKALGHKAAPGSATGRSASSTAALLTDVSASTLNQVGKGALGTNSLPNPLIKITGPALTAGGKPEILYMGAEYCPFCATERWAIAVALSRFGTLSAVHFIHSDPNDFPASIPTLTFYKASYASKYVTFTPVELEKIDRSPLQTPTAAQAAIYRKYDGPPYVTTGAGAIPFMDLGGKYVISGASYSYTVLQGKTWRQVAAALHDPSTPIAQGADGAANYLTAAICKLTGNQPASACTPAVKSIEAQI